MDVFVAMREDGPPLEGCLTESGDQETGIGKSGRNGWRVAVSLANRDMQVKRDYKGPGSADVAGHAQNA